MHLYTDEGNIDTTANHPFYVMSKGWVAAGDLAIGDEVYNLDGTTSTILGSEIKKLDEPVLVYNLEVEGFHSYFVCCVPVLVHNQCTIDANALKEKYEVHIFSPDHIKGGIMNLGSNKDDIMDTGLNIIRNVDAKIGLSNWPNPIRTNINGYNVSIQAFVKDGNLLSFDMYVGWSNRNYPNIIIW